MLSRLLAIAALALAGPVAAAPLRIALLDAEGGAAAIFVTPEGLAQIERRVAELEKSLAEKLEDEPRKQVQRDLRYWRNRLASAQPAPAPQDGKVGIGSRLRFTLHGKPLHCPLLTKYPSLLVKASVKEVPSRGWSISLFVFTITSGVGKS